MQISGEMQFGETSSAAWAISRLYGFGVGIYLLSTALMIAVISGLATLADMLLPDGVAGGLMLPLIIVGSLTAIFGVMRLQRWRMRQALRARGQSLITPITFTVDEHGFRMHYPDADVRLAWSGVTDVVQTKTHWVFALGGLGYCVPRRFFANVADERAFIRAALAQLEEPARARSGKATAFVAWE